MKHREMLLGTGAFALALTLSGQAWGETGTGEIVETYGAEHPSYSELDVDRDGVLSKAEAAGRKGLLSEWLTADANEDNVIDRSEFAAFEARFPAAYPTFQLPPEGDIR